MKRKFFLMALLLAAPATQAQIAKWVIRPDYSSLKFDADNALVIGQRGGETSFWTERGKALATTKDSLCTFRENRAVTLNHGSDIVTGFYSTSGEFVKIELCRVAYAQPYFSSGFLLVKQGDSYQFVDGEGKMSTEKYSVAFPYNAGQAACCTYEDVVKKKNPLCFYITAKRERIALSLGGKPIDASDVDFISSLSDDGVGIVVTKHKLYYYNSSTQELSPLYEKAGETDKKRQAAIDGALQDNMQLQDDSLYLLTAKAGKTGQVQLLLDHCYVPLKISFFENGSLSSEKTFHRTAHVVPTFTSQISTEKSVANGKWMVAYCGAPLLAGIFDEVKPVKDDIGLVCMNGKWGMIDVLKEGNFQFRINGGKPVGFRHSSYEAAIRLDLPIAISSTKTSFEVVESDKIHIDGTSIDRLDTENGNYVQYNCAIDIPPTLQDTIAQIGCNAQVSYDGLVSPLKPITFSAWHVKRFNVDIIEQSAVIGGEFSFTINIDEQKAIGETDYPFEVKITTDSLTAYADKLSETRYKITLSSLSEGVNEFSVNILEDGCPPQRFPFEVTYTKPVPKTRNKSAVSAKAEVRKKQVKPAPKPTGVLI